MAKVKPPSSWTITVKQESTGEVIEWKTFNIDYMMTYYGGPLCRGAKIANVELKFVGKAKIKKKRKKNGRK